MIVKELIAVLGFELDEHAAHKFEHILHSLGFKAAAAVGIIAGVGAAIAELAHKSAEYAHETELGAKKLGLTTDALQELNYAAMRSGVPAEALQTGLRFIEKNAYDAANGSAEAAKSFAALGLSAADLRKKSPADILNLLADRFEHTEDPIKRSALAMKIAGRQGTALIPILEKGSAGINMLRQRAHETGSVLDKELVEEGAEAALAWSEFATVFRMTWIQIGARFTPILRRISEGLTNLRIKHKELIEGGFRLIERAVHWFMGVLDSASDVVENHTRYLKILALVLGAVLVPAIFKLGQAWLIAAGRMALAMAPVIGSVALALLFAAILEDIYLFASGKGSALQDLYEFFTKEAQKPDANWMVKVVARLVAVVHDAIDAINQLFGMFGSTVFDLENLGIKGALEAWFNGILENWKQTIRAFIESMMNIVPGMNRVFESVMGPMLDKYLPRQTIDSIATPTNSAVVAEQTGRPLSLTSRMANVAEDIRSRMPAAPVGGYGYAALRAQPSSPDPAMAFGAGSMGGYPAGSMVFEGSRVNISVTGTGQSTQDVESMRRAVEQTLEEHDRKRYAEASRQLSNKKVR